MKILLVEDSVEDAAAFVAQCASLDAGLEVVRAATLADAKRACCECQALVVDLDLPDASREATLEFVRAHRRKKPTVVYSVDDEPHTIVDLGRMDVGYLFKGAYHPKQILIEIYRSQGAILEWRDVRRRIEELIGKFERLLNDLSQADP